MLKSKKNNKQNLRHSMEKIKSIKAFQSKSLLKPVIIRLRKPSSNSDMLIIQQKKIQQDQRLRISNYKSFIKKLKGQKDAKVPSCFLMLNIGQKNDNFIEIDYQNINFSILAQPCEKLIQIATQIIGKFGIGEICGRFALNKMVKQICNGYNIVSYHNFSHAFSLMHMLYNCFKMDRKFKQLFTKQQAGFALVAALAHDLNHKGTNNAFQIKIDSQLSKIGEKQAVLQKMHVRTLFSILKNKNITILDKTKNPQKMRQLITRAILATDVAKHFKNLQKLTNLRESSQFDSKSTDQRYFILEQVFHGCDIGNPCLDYKQYMNWAILLSYQFHTQTILQEQHKVQVTEFLKYKGTKSFYNGQIGFINNLVFPLWKELSSYFYGFNSLLKNVESNLTKLKEQSLKNEKEQIFIRA